MKSRCRTEWGGLDDTDFAEVNVCGICFVRMKNRGDGKVEVKLAM